MKPVNNSRSHSHDPRHKEVDTKRQRNKKGEGHVLTDLDKLCHYLRSFPIMLHHLTNHPIDKK
jgi:hypothetical protein